MEIQGELKPAPPVVGDTPSPIDRRCARLPRASHTGRSASDPVDVNFASPYRPIVSIAIAVVCGIVLDRYGGPNVSAEFSWALASLSLVAWWFLWRARRNSVGGWLLLIAAASAAASWHDLRWSRFDGHDVGRYAPYEIQPACVTAIARESPDRLSAPQWTPLRAIPTGERSRLLVQLTAIRDGTQWRRASGICLLTIEGHLLGVRAGDRLRIVGQLARTMPPLNPGEFDFAAHARADRQLARLRSSAPECVVLLERGTRVTIAGILDRARNGAKRMVSEFVGPERAGLSSAILLGAREGLQYDQTEPYLVTGTIHVLVVSGMNVAILGAGLLAMMRLGWLARRLGLAVIIAMVAAYTLLAEMQPPVVRAAVFGILLCVAAWTGRRGTAFNSLAASALIVLTINPADLFRAGPQLSFLAVGTLMWVGNRALFPSPGSSDPLDRLIETAQYWYERLWVWLGRPIVWLVLTSLAVWLTTLPLVLMRFHVGSPISVLISPAVWLFVFVAMWSGFAMLALGWLIPPLGHLCGAVCSASLGGLEHVVAWAETIPAGHFWAPGPAWWWVLGFYVALLAAMIWGRALAPPRWQLAALCAWILVGLVPPMARAASRDALECSFVAVGHGTCVVLEAPTGETLLYDAGALGSPEFATQSIASYLWHRGIQRIDGLVVSHADVDHYNAVPGLLERFHVGTVYVSPVMFDEIGEIGSVAAPQTFREVVRRAGVPIREIWSGDRLQVGPEVMIHVFHPPRRGVLGNDNANSVTLSVEYRGRRVLLPGDLESPGLDDVMAELPCDCDILLAPHHGSRQSDPPGFAAWSTPEWVVISGGSNDDFVEPVVAAYRRAGAEVLQTHRVGAVRYSLRPAGTGVAASRPREVLELAQE